MSRQVSKPASERARREHGRTKLATTPMQPTAVMTAVGVLRSPYATKLPTSPEIIKISPNTHTG